jgi:hypothetical protein
VPYSGLVDAVNSGVFLQLPDIDNGMLAIGQSHESSIVTAAIARQQPSAA